jgi:hypothetical protein
MEAVNAIKVTYKFIDGAHFFVTTDKEAAGLCVANADLKTAFDEVAAQLSAIYAFNHGKKCNFQPAVPFETFKGVIDAIQQAAKAADQSGTIVANTVQPWTGNLKVGALIDD